MTYPAPRYQGSGGEASATYRPVDHEPDLTYGTAPPSTTSRRPPRPTSCSASSLADGSARSGPEPHFHRTIAESFYVLLGSIRIYDGREWVETGPGDFVHVPPGGLHGFRNESGAPASMLIHFAPGAPREGYFEGLARFAEVGRPSEEELADFYDRHDNIYV